MEQKSKFFWGRSTFLVVTGASQGIGRKIAVEFSRLLDSNSTVLLLARSVPNLTETKNQIGAIRSDINIEIESMDFSKPDSQHFSDILSRTSGNRKYDLNMLVHNAGSIIVNTPASQMNDATKWNEYMTVNLYSATILTSAFLSLFKDGGRSIVNISSLCGKKPFKGLGMYCVAKASRESYFKVLAEENPALDVLNYSPGPIDTDMFNEIANDCCFPDIRETFMELINKKSLVKVEDTVAKLIFLLGQEYERGASIDFYDDHL